MLRKGAYDVFSLVGQPVAGQLTSGSSGIWQGHQKLNKAPALASVNEALEVPTDFARETNYPNPFNPETTIRSLTL